jgi:formylglycine-generating enzyme required for sulfatase activity
VFLFVAGCASKPEINLNSDDIPVFVALPAGSYMMGDQIGSGDSDERPAHKVTVNSFSMGKFEVTQKQYAYFTQVTKVKPPLQNSGAGLDHPVVNVSMHDAVQYAKWLSDVTGRHYRLPTEEEWEYAARSGALSLFSNGNAELDVCSAANIADKTAINANVGWSEVTLCQDAAVYTAAVGSYRPNGAGLHDMMGNVWEWTASCYSQKYILKGMIKNTKCEENVVRGGSFMLPANSARLSNREAVMPAEKNNQIGFRLVMEP